MENERIDAFLDPKDPTRTIIIKGDKIHKIIDTDPRILEGYYKNKRRLSMLYDPSEVHTTVPHSGRTNLVDGVNLRDSECGPPILVGKDAPAHRKSNFRPSVLVGKEPNPGCNNTHQRTKKW